MLHTSTSRARTCVCKGCVHYRSVVSASMHSKAPWTPLVSCYVEDVLTQCISKVIAGTQPVKEWGPLLLAGTCKSSFPTHFSNTFATSSKSFATASIRALCCDWLTRLTSALKCFTSRPQHYRYSNTSKEVIHNPVCARHHCMKLITVSLYTIFLHYL